MFYENFVRVCKERRTTPSRACLDAGMGKNRSSNWKTNGTIPKQDELQKLAEVLDCDVSDFFSDHTGPRYTTAYDSQQYHDLLKENEELAGEVVRLKQQVIDEEALAEELRGLVSEQEEALTAAKRAREELKRSHRLSENEKEMVELMRRLVPKMRIRLLGYAYDLVDESTVPQ